MLKGYVRFIVLHRSITIVTICILTLFFAYQIWNPWMAGRCLASLMKDESACWWSWKLKMVVDPKTILPQDHPYVQLNDRIEKTFGGSRVVVIGIEPKDGDIFNPQILSIIRGITEEVKKIPGIKEENVVSLTDRKVKYVESTGDTIKVERLMEAVPQSKEELEAFRKRVYSNNLYVGSLVSGDGRAASIITDFREWVSSEQSAVSSKQWTASEAEGSKLKAQRSEQASPTTKHQAPNTDLASRTTNHESRTTDSKNPWWKGSEASSFEQGSNPWWKGDDNGSAPAGGWPSGGFRMSDSAIYEAVQKASSTIQSASRGGEANVYIGGLPVALAYMEKDSARIVFLFPLALFIMMIILYWAFRSFQGMLLPLLTALLSVIWALGLMGLTAIPMDPFNTLTPILILAVAAGHSIQILKRYYEELAMGRDNKTAVVEATTKIAPVTITAALVAAASFGSLVTFQLKTFQAFGLFTAFGILSALILELTFIPALRSILRPPRSAEAQSSKLKAERSEQEIAQSSKLKDRDSDFQPSAFSSEQGTTLLDRILLAIARQATSGRSFRIVVGSFVILLIALVGTLLVRVDNSLKSQFFETTRLRIDEKALNNHFGGTSTFYILIEGDQPNALKNPAVLGAIDKLQRTLEAVPGVGKTESYVDYVKKMNQTFHGGNPQYDRVPQDQQLVNDFLFLYAISGNPADFARLVDYDYRQAVIWSYLKSDSTALAEDLIRQVEDYARQNSSLVEIAQSSKVKAERSEEGVAESSKLKAQRADQTKQNFQLSAFSLGQGQDHTPRLTLGVAGSAPVTVALNRTMVEGKIKNIVQIAVIIFVASALVLRSFLGGLLVLLPLTLAVLINFGVMGLTGITLGIGTAAISAMAVGIGADYAIYLLFRIREEYKAESSRLKAQRSEEKIAQGSKLKDRDSGFQPLAFSFEQGPAESSKLKEAEGLKLKTQRSEEGEAQSSKLKAQEGKETAQGFQPSAFSFEQDTLSAAIQRAVMTAGKAIVFVALSIATGYAILPFSGYYLHMEGILVPLAMITSCIGALVLLSTLVYVLRPKFIVRQP